MKKLLAILLTLAMLVPMGGVAEETAPGATRTVIFLKDFNAKVLGADIDEAEEKAVNDFLRYGEFLFDRLMFLYHRCFRKCFRHRFIQIVIILDKRFNQLPRRLPRE